MLSSYRLNENIIVFDPVWQSTFSSWMDLNSLTRPPPPTFKINSHPAILSHHISWCKASDVNDCLKPAKEEEINKSHSVGTFTWRSREGILTRISFKQFYWIILCKDIPWNKLTFKLEQKTTSANSRSGVIRLPMFKLHWWYFIQLYSSYYI